jgi:hypothetical protein
METLPTFVVERLRVAVEVLVGKLSGFLDIRQGEDFAGEVGFDDVLQPGELGVVEEPSARANVGVNMAGVRRVLPPVRELVAVRAKDRIEAQRLNGVLLGTRGVQRASKLCAKQPLCSKERRTGERQQPFCTGTAERAGCLTESGAEHKVGRILSARARRKFGFTSLLTEERPSHACLSERKRASGYRAEADT